MLYRYINRFLKYGQPLGHQNHGLSISNQNSRSWSSVRSTTWLGTFAVIVSWVACFLNAIFDILVLQVIDILLYLPL